MQGEASDVKTCQRKHASQFSLATKDSLATVRHAHLLTIPVFAFWVKKQTKASIFEARE